MFKKRVLKKSSSKRVKDEVQDLNDTEVVSEIKLDSKVKSETDKNHSTIEKEELNGRADNSDEESKLENETSSKKANFKPDTMVEEQYHQLKKNEKILLESKNKQKRDRDGDKIYTGMISRKSKKDELVKPSSTHVRQNYIMDYQADVCKDFLKNGYCGFGDTCKFLHYREEFKKVETPELKEWEVAAKRRKKF